MPCFAPLHAVRTPDGGVSFDPRDRQEWQQELLVPCGRCIGCQSRRAADWTYRARLEHQLHDLSAFVTLTYDDQHLPRLPGGPVSLRKRDFVLWMKRVRKQYSGRLVRFFACGEYGEKNGRPHYHAILWGVSPVSERELSDLWGKGIVQALPVIPERIAYVAGYVAKKLGVRASAYWSVDLETGEAERWVPPFLLMSRRPGIGLGVARRHPQVFRDFAVLNGSKVPVPRALRKVWEESVDDFAVAARADDVAAALVPRSDQEVDALYVMARKRLEDKLSRRSL